MRRMIAALFVVGTMLGLVAGAGPFGVLTARAPAVAAAGGPVFREYPVPQGSHPHDVAPAPSGAVWYTAQTAGELGQLDPKTGQIRRIKLGEGSAPHGVIVGPDGAAWVTDGGLNAILSVSEDGQIKRFPLPAARDSANLNSAIFDRVGLLWFTGQSGVYGELRPATGHVSVWPAPRGPGPYGMAATPQGTIYFASLAGSYVGRIDAATGSVSVLQPPTAGQGARRISPDSKGRIWVSEWNAGNVALLDPATGRWREWRLPGAHPMPYAVYVDEHDTVWLSDWGANALVRFDPARETFTAFPLPSPRAEIRQMLGRPGEVWGAESGVDKLVVYKSR